MLSAIAEIQKAIETLNLPPLAFRHLPCDEGERIYRGALRHFVGEGEPRWWWKHFATSASVNFASGDGWRHIPNLVPDANESVWFIAEDDSLPFYPVFEATPTAISAVIGACYGFEYYIVQKSFEWLLCENHHDRMIGVGKVVEKRLRDYWA